MELKTVAGCDVAYDERYAYAVWVVLSFPGLRELAVRVGVEPISAEYRSGYLAERELPPLITVFKKLQNKPEVVICDGAGIAHPHRFGLACALGRAIEIPTIGCAKSRFVGEAVEPGKVRGSYSPIRIGEEVVGVVLRTRSNVKPVYVSPGYLITLDEAWRVVLACCREARVPEPIRIAHSYALRLRHKRVRSGDIEVNQSGIG